MSENYEIKIIFNSQSGQFTQEVNRVNQSLDQLDKNTKKAGESGTRMGRAFGDMGSIVKGAISAFVVTQFAQLTSEIYEQGSAVSTATAVYNQLAKEVGDTEVTLSRLQGVTGGIVDNFNLMEGASRLLSMGLATNQDEVVRLTELAVKLGGAMGNDAASSIENFSLLLANESLLRLDSFGISSSDVRVRIDELLASGEALTRSDAFRLAVLEEGGRSLDRLGDAATAAETPVARLQTRWKNFTDDFALGAATIIDEAARITEEAGGTLEMLLAIVNLPISQADEAGVRRGRAQQFLESSGVEGTQVVNTLPSLALRLFAASQGVESAAYVSNVQYSDEQLSRAERFLATLEAINGVTAQIQTGVDDANLQSEIQAQQLLERTENRLLFDSVMGQEGHLSSLFNPRFMNSGSGFFTPRQFDDINRAVDGIAITMNAIRADAEAGIISDAELGRAEEFYGRMVQWRDVVREGAAALENISLDRALGVTGNINQLGSGITNQLLAAMRGTEMDDADLRRLEDVFALRSGALTDASIAMRDDVIPMLMDIADQFGEDALVEAIDNLETRLRESALMGLSPEQVAFSLPTWTGYQYATGSNGGTQFEVKPGDTASGIAAQYGLTVDQVLAAAGASSPYALQPGTYGAGGGGSLIPYGSMDTFTRPMQGGGQPYFAEGMDLGDITEFVAGFSQVASEAPTVAGEIDVIASSLDEAAVSTDTILANLGTISGMVVPVVLDVALNDPNGIIAMLTNGQGLEVAIRNVVQANGGVAPGTDPRARVLTQ